MNVWREHAPTMRLGWCQRSAVIAAVLASAVACSAPSVEPHAEPAVTATPTINDWRQIVLPLDAYELSLKDTVLVERAEHQMAGICMERFGFTWNIPFNERVASGDSPSHYRLYGLLDAAHAAAFGYHNAVREPIIVDQPDPILDNGQNPLDYANVLGAKRGGGVYRGMKIPDGGCFGEARRKVAAGGPAFDSSLPEKLSIDSWARSNKDSRVLVAFRRWSQCMTTSGFKYSTPMEANNDEHWTGNAASETEIIVATTDVRCKKETNLTGVRMAVDSAYQRVAIEAQAEALDAVRKGHERQLRNAGQILAQS